MGALRWLAPERSFELQLEADLPPVWADASRLRTVLDNLLNNALKYSDPHSPIIISAQRYNYQAKVSVTNFGLTISPADQKKIFAKFYRGKGGQQQPGHGLGLYLARRLIELHGGSLWVESLPVGVTTFVFTLPLVNQ